MATDHGDNLFRTAVGSDIVRVRPNAVIQLYRAGTTELVTEVLSDATGHYAFTDLLPGHYDVKVDGRTINSFHHIPADHTHLADQTWTSQLSGAITGDINADANHEIFGPIVAGSIISVVVIAQRVNPSSDIVVHILRGDAGAATSMTFSTHSVWQLAIANEGGGQTKYRDKYNDSNPGITVAANQCVTAAIDYHVSGVSGVTVAMVFRPNSQ